MSAAAVAAAGLLSTRLGVGRLPPAAASDARVLLNALSAFSLLALGLQIVLVGILVDRESSLLVRLPPDFTRVAAVAVVAGFGAAIAAVVVIDSTVRFEVQAAALVGTAVACIVVSLPGRAVLLGEERWRDHGAISVAIAVARLGMLGVVVDRRNLLAVLLALAVGELVGAALTVIATRHSQALTAWPPGAWRRFWIGLTSSSGLMLVVFLCSVSWKRNLGASGPMYDESASVGRLAFILALTTAFVYFPAIARLPVGSIHLRRAFHRAMTLTTAVAALATSAILAFPSQFADLVIGDGEWSVGTVRILTIAFACIGIAVVPFTQFIAHGSLFALWALPIAVPMMVAQVSASSATVLAWCAAGTAVLLVTTSALPAFLRVQPVLRPELVDQSSGQVLADSSGVTIVVPSYNPGPFVVLTLAETDRSFREAGLELRLVVVSDGSTDGSDDKIDQLSLPHLTHVRTPVNMGKGSALRTGFALARTPIVGFVDADGDLSPHQLVEMARIQQETGADVVFGSKRHIASSVDVPVIRKVYSRVYQTMIRWLFQLDIADTQTGIKLYRRRVLDAALPVVREAGFALDLELFVAARANGFAHFVEVPVTMTRQGVSTISLRSVARMVGQTLRIFWHAKVTLQYLRAAASTRGPQQI